jgi:ssDNA-binding Zn-finger/Zn-ribbon topoisomerase 1
MRKLTTEEFVLRAKEIHGECYDYSRSVYNGSHGDVEIICKNHGSFWATPNNHIGKKSICPKCYLANRLPARQKNTTQFIEDAIKVHGDLYSYNNAIYTKALEQIEIVCKKHGSFFQRANDHLRGYGCPNCHKSKGELIIKSYLLDKEISFVEQYRNSNCKDKYTLPFDFYLPDYNLIIEFHGIQHYQYIPYWHKSIDNFERLQNRDRYKREWAIKNNIRFFEISYKESDIIEDILSTLLY